VALVLYKKRNHTQVHESYTVAALPNIATRNSITHENIETSQGCQMIQQNADLRGENSSTYTFLSAPNQYAPVTGVQFFATREIPFASHVATIPHDEPFPVGVPSAGPSSEATNMRSPMFGIEPLYQFAHCKILIAEDNVINQRIMFKFLGKLGLHNVVVASDGQIAVNKFRESMEAMQPFNFIFMDDQMPALSGTDATRLIREMGYRGPICGLLAHVMLKEKQRVIDAGMTTVLQKPFRLRNIREILDQYLVVDAPELEETMLPEFIDETPLPRRKPVVKSRL
jgi:CheY-like chemotaxis protein